MHIAEVFINIPIKSIAKAYSYRIPPELDFLDSGWRVIVPFGGRSIEGFIVKTFYAEESEVKLKDIISNQVQQDNGHCRKFRYILLLLQSCPAAYQTPGNSQFSTLHY